VILRLDLSAKCKLIGIRPTRASTSIVGKVQKVPVIAAFLCMLVTVAICF